MTDLAIEATGLAKSFGDTKALAGVDLAVRTGTVLGVLGPNGAGKTTAVRILATLLRADSGTARVNGFDVRAQPDKVRQSIGLTGQFASVDDDLTGTQNLVMIGQLLDLSKKAARARAAELLEWFDLTEAAGKQAKHYSGGMRRRLDLAASLVGRPSVIFLDEPTTGGARLRRPGRQRADSRPPTAARPPCRPGRAVRGRRGSAARSAGPPAGHSPRPPRRARTCSPGVRRPAPAGR
jgi:oleandomycin transport system ATP-binding protein